MDLNEVSGDDGDLQYTDINEKTDTPPPCLVRPSSNSINTTRQISGFNDECKFRQMIFFENEFINILSCDYIFY